jgi:hypothetical protein
VVGAHAAQRGPQRGVGREGRLDLRYERSFRAQRRNQVGGRLLRRTARPQWPQESGARAGTRGEHRAQCCEQYAAPADPEGPTRPATCAVPLGYPVRVRESVRHENRVSQSG